MPGKCFQWEANMNNQKTGRSILGLALVIMLAISTIIVGIASANTVQTYQNDRSIDIVSVASDGTQGNDWSSWPSISQNGCCVAFWSKASNLVSGDSNSFDDIFVHDQQKGVTEIVSIASDGTQGNGNADYWMDISEKGRYVTFSSDATNLVAGDTNIQLDVFVRDRQTGTTERVSVASDGSQGIGTSFNPSITSDGRYVAFQSTSSNLISGDHFSSDDIFVHDRLTGNTEIVSVSTNGVFGNNSSEYPSISHDGHFVAFQSDATNLVENDTNNRIDIFVHDRELNETTLVSLKSDGSQYGSHSLVPEISGDGRFVTFAASPGAVYRHDRMTGKTDIVSENDPSFPAISGDGRYVVYEATIENNSFCHPENPKDIYVRDMYTGISTCISTSITGDSKYAPGNYPSISADGHTIAFTSHSPNLVDGDNNGFQDIFIFKWSGIQPMFLPISINK